MKPPFIAFSKRLNSLLAECIKSFPEIRCLLFPSLLLLLPDFFSSFSTNFCTQSFIPFSYSLLRQVKEISLHQPNQPTLFVPFFLLPNASSFICVASPISTTKTSPFTEITQPLFNIIHIGPFEKTARGYLQ
eukprot:Sdes_comp17662_c0_seq1m6929